MTSSTRDGKQPEVNSNVWHANNIKQQKTSDIVFPHFINYLRLIFLYKKDVIKFGNTELDILFLEQA